MLRTSTRLIFFSRDIRILNLDKRFLNSMADTINAIDAFTCGAFRNQIYFMVTRFTFKKIIGRTIFFFSTEKYK